MLIGTIASKRAEFLFVFNGLSIRFVFRSFFDRRRVDNSNLNGGRQGRILRGRIPGSQPTLAVVIQNFHGAYVVEKHLVIGLDFDGRQEVARYRSHETVRRDFVGVIRLEEVILDALNVAVRSVFVKAARGGIKLGCGLWVVLTLPSFSPSIEPVMSPSGGDDVGQILLDGVHRRIGRAIFFQWSLRPCFASASRCEAAS